LKRIVFDVDNERAHLKYNEQKKCVVLSDEDQEVTHGY